MLILVGAACLVWILFFSLTFVELSGLALSNGLLMAVALIFASAAWLLVTLREIRNAVELPDPFATENLHDHPRFRPGDDENSTKTPLERWSQTRTQTPHRPRRTRSSKGEMVSPSAAPEIFHPDV